LKKGFFICLLAIFLLLEYCPAQAQGLMPEKDEYIIVIDPGHGGDNAGTTSNPNFKEKEITMKTARALVEELSKYEGVSVYLTHEADVDLSLKERAVFAEKKNADFLFSLHYNASENHTMFGTEVWIPLYAPYHAMCYEFAYLQQLEMQELGLFSRGIKTRINDNGTDYYGVIRESVAREIPAVIIEHCYVDEARDGSYVDDDTDFAEFGRRDAIAIAKFLGLEPSEEVPELTALSRDTIIAHTYEDKSTPKNVQIETQTIDYDNNELTIVVSATEGDTPLMYYDYSLDGGKTYSKLYPWPGTDMLANVYDDYFALTFSVPANSKPKVILRAYNKFDLFSLSNALSNIDFSSKPTPQPQAEAIDSTDTPDTEQTEDVAAVQTDKESVSDIKTKRFFLLVAFILLWILLLSSIVCFIIKYFGKKNN